MTSGVTVTLNELVALRARSRSLPLDARRAAMSASSGGYHSAYRGRGLEFDEVRLYQSGDDARTIDWRVSARRGQIHTKLFREERERPVFLLVDLHPGMFFGTRTAFKSVIAARLATLVAWAAEHAGDRIGGIVTSEKGHIELQPRARREGVLRLINAIVKLQPETQGETQPGRLDEAVARLSRVAHTGGLVFLLSDFREMGSSMEKHLTRLSHHHDVIAGLIYDPLEAHPPRSGIFELGNQQSRQVVDFGHAETHRNWQVRFRKHRGLVMDYCRRHEVHFMDIATNANLVNTLRMGISSRGRGS